MRVQSTSNEPPGRFAALLERHVPKLRVRGPKATGCCPFHQDTNPSFSADLAKGAWYCHACHIGGGVKKFAELVGESWAIASLPRRERTQAAVSIRRHEAEQKARAILQQREDKRLDEIFVEWRETNRDAANAAELLGVFHRHPDLEKDFSDLAEKAERDYSATVHHRVLLEARLDGEVV